MELELLENSKIEEHFSRQQFGKIIYLPDGNYSVEFYKKGFNQGGKIIKTGIPKDKLRAKISSLYHKYPYVIIKENNDNKKDEIKLNFDFRLD